ncbi:Bug family tripartite tricarboxylate transporter substrate binding protein [Falsiroseomonas oryzae]|uniref:Bug family tripartite tricarboxylate transporter substrate binding protein n=1 Tax=Falsiroseomonas oryzae TaxID=2766473 RepID=UPI0022EB0DD9|nr:tripartite tricarboxylate transporter substrate binding protein [Roseomonas sp. MO-31]
MSLTRRALCALALSAPALRRSAAQVSAFPERPMRIVVPFPPGGATDSAARILADGLAQRYGRPVVVENRAGASGTVGGELVSRAAPDGHTLLVGSPVSISLGRVLLPTLAYDPMRDLAPVSILFTADHAFAVHPGLAARTVPEFIALARASARPLSFGSSGIGTTLHLIGEMFRMRAGIELLHVPYRGSAPAVTDLVAGNLDAIFDQLAATGPHVQGGRLRLLATTGPTRHRAWPDVPTVAETLPGFVGQSWNGVAAPGGTPPALVERISADIAAVMAEPAAQARMQPLGVDGATSRPAEFQAFIAEDAARWTEVIRATGVTLG